MKDNNPLFASLFFTNAKGGVNITRNTGVKFTGIYTTKGICRIESSIKDSTLSLKIYVARFVTNETKEIQLMEDVKFVSYGKITTEISNIDTCLKVLSGEEALKKIKLTK